MNTFNINTYDLLLILGFFIIQQNNLVLEISGYILIGIISYLEIKKRQYKKQHAYISIIINASKKDYKIYNNIIENINNKVYQRIDIMKTYSYLLDKVNNLDYDFDKLNNCLDIFCILAKIDNILYFNKKITKHFIEDGQEILDIYARLVNLLYNITVINKEYDINNIYLCKELDELYLKYNYNDFIKKINNFCYKYNINNIYQL